VKSKIDKKIEDLEVSIGKAGTARSDNILMTVNELAVYIRCHTTSIYRLLKRHSIPGFRVGGNWRFSRRAIDAWMAGPFNTSPRRVRKLRRLEG
jgi:excisionase family DNA binding protein